MVKPEWKAPLNPAYNPSSDPVDNGIVGKRVYELSNHLGNVMVTVSDIKIGKSTPGGPEIAYYEADVVTAQDYYPFGMGMPGRKFSANGLYRFGFNGKENDNEIKGEGNQQDYGMRVYDPRLGRFLSVDPLSRDFPYFSVYHFAGCSPIKFIDLDGGEPKDYVENWVPRPMGWFGSNRLVEGTSEGNSSTIVEDPALGWIRVQAIYDETTKSNWFVHHNSGTGKYYYYKANDNQHGILTIQIPKNGLAIISGGTMEEFETANAEAARIRLETADLLTGVTVGTLVGVPGALEYGLALVYKVYRNVQKWQENSRYEKEIEGLLSEGNKNDRNGYTKVGRALQKHSNRKKTSYEKPSSEKPDDYNKAGELELKNILESEGRIVKPNKKGGKDYIDPKTGKGARYLENGTLDGFLEP